MLNDAQVRDIDRQKEIDPDWYNVYGLGLTGKLTGTILSNWDVVAEMPTTHKRRFIGIDFGFTNDPTAIVDCMLAEGDIWINELAYDCGLTNPDIAKIVIDSVGTNIPIVADSAEPKSIVELRSFGLNIEGALKGPDSINTGIQVMNRYKSISLSSLATSSTNIADIVGQRTEVVTR